MENERSAATEAGMDDFISKPVRVEDIQRAVLRAAEGLARRVSTTRQEAIS
jgi:FixJ family two-component response regulator